jgi:SnoaL-like protein
VQVAWSVGIFARMRPKQVVQAWVEAFNRGNADEIAGFYTENAVNHQAVNEPVEGRAAIHAMFKREFGAAKMVCQIENLFEDGRLGDSRVARPAWFTWMWCVQDRSQQDRVPAWVLGQAFVLKSAWNTDPSRRLKRPQRRTSCQSGGIICHARSFGYNDVEFSRSGQLR